MKSQDVAIEEKKKREAEALAMIKNAMGGNGDRRHFKRPVEHHFTKSQRGDTTILIGGLTFSHETLIAGAFRGMGYNIEVMPSPNVDAFQLGKEYGNNGQCNPTYFTVGNLVQYLQGLEEKGMSRKDINEKYVFLTAGACGPCRFGMYEAEFRLALRNSGFDGFRVLLFQQKGGLDQAEVEAGLEMDLDFFLGMLNGMNIGDMLNEIAYMIRPYEIEEGATDKVLHDAQDYIHDVLRDHNPAQLGGRWGKILAGTPLEGAVTQLLKFKDQLTTDYYTGALKKVRADFDEIELDRFRTKPIVKITGEFWAQTTEGDGNYNMFRFLEGEGAEVIVEPIGTWIMYMMHQVIQETRDKKGLIEGEEEAAWWHVRRRLAAEIKSRKKLGTIKLAEKIFKREYTKLQNALGAGVLHELVDQYELQRAGHPYYNSRAGGGEGHLEVAKNIYYSNHGLAHMVLSLKPFGCMPSTQSDGAQAAVIEHYKDMIYLPIETSGEGEVNAHSRVQMALGNARIKAKQEFKEAIDRCGRTVEELRAYVDEHAEMKKPTYVVPHCDGVVGKAANFVLHVAERMDKEEGKTPKNARLAA